MNQSPEDNRLDDLLRSWSKGITGQLSNEDLLIAQITGRLSRVDLTETPQRLRRHATVCVVLAVTAVVAFFAVLFPFRSAPSNHTSSSHVTGLASLQSLAVPDQVEVRRQTRLLEELHRLFGQRFRWASEQRGDLNLEVEETADPSVTQAVLLRLVLRRSQSGVTVRPDVIEVLTHSEQTVRVNCGPTNDETLEIWTYVLPDGMVLVSTGFVGERSGGVAESLQTPGVAMTVDSRATNSQWQMVQSVTLIGERLL